MSTQYDFIVIGGGTSGLVIANRLSKDPKIQVLVLEAGDNHIDNPTVRAPGTVGANIGGPADWRFKTIPQPHLNDREISLNQGKALGGSSAINIMMFIPPSKSIIDAWLDLGNPGWDWEAMKSYFAKTYTVEVLPSSLKTQLGVSWPDKSTTGPIQTSHSLTRDNPLPKAWDETFDLLGFRMSEDPFSGSRIGSFSSLASVDPKIGERSYAATAYYSPVATRQNLHVVTNVFVSKIVLKKEGSEVVATGAEYLREGQAVAVKARKEVILAAGALQSPKMLELSGIGNRQLLESHGIKALVDNPHVGENLQDHFVSAINVIDEDPGDESLLDTIPAPLDAALSFYIKQNPGPFTIEGISSVAFLPVMNLLNPEGQITLQSLFDTYPEVADPNVPLNGKYYSIARQHLDTPGEASASFFNSIYKSIGPSPKLRSAIGLSLSQPLSRGSVHISSSNPLDAPIIDPNYFSHPLDLEIYARHLQFLETIAQSPPFSTLISTLNSTSTSSPKPKSPPGHYFEDLEVAKEYVKRTGTSMWHPTSTCAMLPRENGGVVDCRLKVYGVKGLRVVDASVMPLITRGNTQATVYAVAERAADLVKEDWGIGGVSV